MRGLAVILILAFLMVSLAPQNASAETTIRIYIAGGIIIGGLSVFWAITIRKDFSENRAPKDDPQKTLFALNKMEGQYTEEMLSQAGLIKILQW